MDKKKILALLEDMFEMDGGTLKEETRLDDLDEWDSLAKLSLIVLMDDEFGKKLSGAEIKEFVTIGDILNYMD